MYRMLNFFIAHNYNNKNTSISKNIIRNIKRKSLDKFKKGSTQNYLPEDGKRITNELCKVIQNTMQ